MSNTCQLVLVSADASAASVGWAGGWGGRGREAQAPSDPQAGPGPRTGRTQGLFVANSPGPQAVLWEVPPRDS